MVVAEVIITEISPYDLNTPTTFMREYNFTSRDEKVQAGEDEVENCFDARTHQSFQEGGQMQESIDELEGASQAFVATRSQLRSRLPQPRREEEEDNDDNDDHDKRGKRAAARPNPGVKPSKGAQARQDEEENDDEPGDVRGTGDQTDPMIFGEEMVGEKLGHDGLKRAQKEDGFVQLMIERCGRAQKSDKRASKFEVIDGALYRVTKSGGPQKGVESQRTYVPPALRAALMRNCHCTVWTQHQNSRSMHKLVVIWYYWDTIEKDIRQYVSTCELCQRAKGTKPSRQRYLHVWKHNKVLPTVCMDLIGPIGSNVSGGRAGSKTPLHILVITDPYTHMLWFEPIVTKSAEEVYEKFVNRFF